MNASRGLVCAAITALSVAMTGCESGTGPGGGIPIIISATWIDEDDGQHTIDFRTPDDGEPSGVLAGREEHPDCNDLCPVGGFWRNGRIEITIDRGGGEHPKFEALYHEENPTRLEFSQIGGGSESFTLLQP
jgi:hypothetical protein